MDERVKSRFMSSDRQAGNQGKLGFVPTSREIVEMELDLIDFSEIQGINCINNICDLSGGTGDQLYWMKQYLNKIDIMCKSYYNELSEERFSECSEKYAADIEMKLNCDFFNLRIGNKENRSLNKKVFSIIRNNPPYMYIEMRGRAVRAEVEFFINNSLLNIDGGIQILEVPLHQLTANKFLSMICYRYEVFIAKFPKNVYENYKQVAIICKKKAYASVDGQAERILGMIENDSIPYIDDIKEKVVSVSMQQFSKAKEVNIFRENGITNKTLRNGLESVIDTLLITDKKENKIVSSNEELKPIIELQPGHLSQLLSSGRYDGIMGNLLIRGGSSKVVEKESIQEDGKSIVVEKEILKPFIELTNKNGDILYKDF